MIKKFNQFINENIALSNSSAKINIDDDEAEMFTTDPVLQKLISDQKVSLLTPELWFESEDINTINILKDYFPDANFDNTDNEDSFVDEEDVEEDGFDEENESNIFKFENYKEKMKDKVEKAKNRDKNPTQKTEGKPDSYKEKMKAKVAKAKETLKPRK